MSKPKNKSRSLIERFERMDTETPITEDEAKTVLEEAGIDATESLARLLSKLDGVEDKERALRFAKAEAAARRARAELEGRNSNLARADVLQRLDLYRKQYPEFSAHFRNFQSASDEELRSLLAEIEELARRGLEK